LTDPVALRRRDLAAGVLLIHPREHQVRAHVPHVTDRNERRKLAALRGLHQHVRRLAELLGDAVKRPELGE